LAVSIIDSIFILENIDDGNGQGTIEYRCPPLLDDWLVRRLSTHPRTFGVASVETWVSGWDVLGSDTHGSTGELIDVQRQKRERSS